MAEVVNIKDLMRDKIDNQFVSDVLELYDYTDEHGKRELVKLVAMRCLKYYTKSISIKGG